MDVVRYATKPTDEYAAYQRAYDYFNLRLFGGKLPRCLITLQRRAGARGYFWRAQFTARGQEQATDEIAMNPATFSNRSDTEILSTLVHEMCHLQQHHFGKPSRNGYHNQEWAAMMITVGLIPSATGQPGGQQTGQSMTHYIQQDGPFARVCSQLLASGFVLRWQAQSDPNARSGGKPKTNSKTKYTCGGCGLNAWAKPTAKLICGACGELMEPAGK